MTLPIDALVNEGLLDPEQTAFFANGSAFTPVNDSTDEAHKRHLEEAAVGLAAAFIVLRNLMSKELQRQQVSMDSDIPSVVAKAWKKVTPFWLKASIPALKQAYSLGVTKQLTDEQITLLASDYAKNLGVYINATSAEALAQGFMDQLREKWSEPIAWMRASAAYGLDKHQMKTYVKQVMTLQSTKQELVPMVARAAVDKAMVMRAEKIGNNEIFHASKLGQSVVWLVQQKTGHLPPDAEKEWITADDERVCSICGPLHHKRVKLDEQWHTIDGEKIWAPGIHPRCRCDVRLIYPEIKNDTWSVVEKNQPGDEYDRDTRGRFARSEQRRGFRPAAEQTRDPEVDRIMEQAREVAKETAGQILSPFAEVESPFTGTTQSPFSSITSPFAQASPFTETKTPFGVASPFSPKRARRRTVLIFAPGQTGPIETEIDEVEDEAEEGPYWTFWNSVREADPKDTGDPWSVIRDTGGRNDELEVGQIINFDFHSIGRPDPAVVANQLNDAPHQLAEIAAEHYNDVNRWTNDPAADALTEDYNEAYFIFHDAATANMERIISRLKDSEIREIFRGGSIRDQQMAGTAEASELKEILDVNKDSQSPIVDSALRYIEKVLPERFDLQEAIDYGSESLATGPSGLLLDATRALEESWVPVPHVPTILVFDKIVGDLYRSYQGITSRVVRGKYRVKSVEETTGNFHYIGDVIERPKNLGGWKIVHLEPVDPEEEVLPDATQQERPFSWNWLSGGE